MTQTFLVRLKQEATRREQILAALVVMALVTAFFRLGYAPMKERIATLQGNLAALQLEKQVLEKFHRATPAAIPGRARDAERNVKSRVLLGEIRSDFHDLPSLMPKLTDPALLGRLSLRGFHFLATAEEAGYSKTDFVLNTEGSFTGFRRYLERLERFPALFRVQDIALKLEKQKDLIQAEIKAQFYRLKKEGAQVSKTGGSV